MTRLKLYDYLIKLQSIAKMGLVYSKDEYALDNYKEINKLTKKMLSELQNVDINRNNYFTKDVYPTPNISCRTVVFNDKKEVLMVKEKVDNGYSLPGGWCDLYESSSKSAIKEVYQEAGVLVKNVKLVGLLHQVPFKENVSLPAYVVLYKAEFKKNLNKHCYETTDVKFFNINKLPKLSKKTTKKELKRMLNIALNDKIVFD